MENNLSYEKLGLLYLGRELALDGQQDVTVPLLLKSKILTTHAAIIGMTGSGKTGLGISLIEEAIMDDIPSIIIDPKGDMGNLLLTFPQLRESDFAAWVDPMEADRKGMTQGEYAADQAKAWKEGLASWGQQPERIKSLRQKTNFTIYTPGSGSGVPISVLDSFAAPSADVLDDIDTLNSLVNSVVTGLLSLVKINADSNKSREYVLLSSLFLHCWRRGEGLDLEGIIGHIVNPPFKKIGVFGLETFYPQSDRMELAMTLNGVIASPAFASWMEGQPLDIQKILYSDDGRPNTAIFSIAHLSESERMFFVTMLLNRFIDWMRRQQGTASLKALLYMDEIFGFFPPTANPPSKKPMLLLLKQARAYGVGVVLATQNPVDLDYKGLSNIGTWFVGRLQTPQDQNRVIDGIAGSSSGDLDKKTLRDLLTDMQGRQFLLRSAHLDDVVLFQTRWVMSYLKGPISLADIEKLMSSHEKAEPAQIAETQVGQPGVDARGTVLDHPPLLADTIPQEYFLHPVVQQTPTFEPWLAARGTVRFVDARRNIDQAAKISLRLYLDERFTDADWAMAEELQYSEEELSRTAPSPSSFYPVPAHFTNLRDLRSHTKSFSDYLYYNKRLELYRVKEFKLESEPGESLADFKIRLMDTLREKKDEEITKLENKYKVKQQRLETKIERAAERIEKEKADVTAKKTDTILSIGAAVLGAFFGRKSLSVSTISRASTGIKNAGRLAREKNQVKRAEQALLDLQDDIGALHAEIEEQTTGINEQYQLENYEIETFSLKPRRSDVFDLDLFLLWEMVP